MAKRKNNGNAEICRSLVNQLERHLFQFRDECLKVDGEDVPKTLKNAIYEFGIDIIHFIDQYRMTDQSIADINKIPGRRTKFEEREFFKWTIKEYQAKKPGGFPTWSAFAEEIDSFNKMRVQHSLSELSIERRTYDDWKRKWRQGTFDHLVHD